MKAKNIMGKIYVSPNAYLGHSETYCEVSVVVFKLQFVEQLRYKTINKDKTKATYLTIKEESGQIKSLPTNSQSFKHK